MSRVRVTSTRLFDSTQKKKRQENEIGNWVFWVCVNVSVSVEGTTFSGMKASQWKEKEKKRVNYWQEPDGFGFGLGLGCPVKYLYSKKNKKKRLASVSLAPGASVWHWLATLWHMVCLSTLNLNIPSDSMCVCVGEWTLRRVDTVYSSESSTVRSNFSLLSR